MKKVEKYIIEILDYDGYIPPVKWKKVSEDFIRDFQD